MTIRYEKCNGDCSNYLQNVTFCVDDRPEPTSQSFANEQTIEMIKILIGKLDCNLFKVRHLLLVDVYHRCWRQNLLMTN